MHALVGACIGFVMMHTLIVGRPNWRWYYCSDKL